MMGPSMSIEDDSSRGVIPRAVDAIFSEALRADEAMEFSIKASYVEIYMERIRDLLDPTGENLQVGKKINLNRRITCTAPLRGEDA